MNGSSSNEKENYLGSHAMHLVKHHRNGQWTEYRHQHSMSYLLIVLSKFGSEEIVAKPVVQLSLSSSGVLCEAFLITELVIEFRV